MGVNKKSEGYILFEKKKSCFLCVYVWNDWGDVCSDDKIKKDGVGSCWFWLACFYAGGRT